ncbi:MAG TPA: ribonuclease R [Candidatus Paceibacterota bacterium]|nr:ribonuclease R [Candidatus Paceibacterota bacterium]
MTETKTYEGVIRVRGKGTGFVGLEDFLEDILIITENLNFALDGDLVELELLPAVPGERRQGKVVRVVEPARSEFIGTVKQNEQGQYYLHPDNFRIHVRPLLPDASADDLEMKVVATIDKWTQPHLDPIATITETLGRSGNHETEMQAIIRSGGFSENFPPEISEAANELYKNQEQIFADAEADPKRRDMRDRLTVTIDPADAKDFDDALSLKQLDNGNYEIGIHIADVSHYVQTGDIIDMEARERGTSIYLVDRVIPMLPEVLSNDLCSLRPETDRLAFSAVFELSPEAEVVDAWYGQTIIHSDTRFSYQDAQAILDAGAGEHHDALATMMRLSRLLRTKRFKNGAIAFEQPEVKFELDEAGKPVRVFVKDRTETMLMIEDFMLLANQQVATHIDALCKAAGRNTAFVYRVHDVPNPDKIEDLATFVHALGYEFNTHKGLVNAKDINKLLKEIEGSPEEDLLKVATIRSMAKAVYSTKNIGHFGLAFKHYTHFTSPIRRYPDLMAHRLLRRHLDNSEITGKEMAMFEKLSIQSSEREMEAVKAERDSVKFKQVEYMSERIGQEFDGIVTGVADWGIYVEEAESKCEGMIKLASIRFDYFEHFPEQYMVKGQKTGTIYRLGDKVRIKVTRADLEERQIDYQLIR